LTTEADKQPVNTLHYFNTSKHLKTTGPIFETSHKIIPKFVVRFLQVFCKSV